MKRPVFISLSPNVQRDDILLSLMLIFCPWMWKKGKAIKLFENEFKKYIGVSYVKSYNSGRSAFLAILKALDFKDGEIIVQGFTCNALINPIIWSGLKPVYIDIDDTLNMNPDLIEQKINNNTKAIIVQHTFGNPANLEKISEICDKHNIILIEDCAHSLGGEYNGRKLGTFGKVSFYSMGRDKIISSVYGGVAVTNDAEIASKLEDYDYPKNGWIIQQLLHPILTKCLVIPLYRIVIGKLLMIFFQKTRLLSMAVSKAEKQGEKPSYIPKRYSNALALLGLKQLTKIDKLNSHRKEIARCYDKFLQHKKVDNQVYMRYSLITDGNNRDFMNKLKKQYIFIDDGWNGSAIVPSSTNMEKMMYVKGICPKAEDYTNRIINLPTHINISHSIVERIVENL
jgi:perosamine synthetase